MAELRVTKEFSFEMAHALRHYSGKCENIHGHTYLLSVTIKGSVRNAAATSADGMVLDFGDLKKIVHERVLDVFDHALVINAADNRVDVLKQLHTKLILTPYQPTAENLILDFVGRIRKGLERELLLFSVTLRETPTSFAAWYWSDNQ